MKLKFALVTIAVLVAALLTAGYLLKDNPSVLRWRLTWSDGYTRRNILWQLYSQIRPGMDFDQVRVVMGPPDNNDTEHVWVWDVKNHRRHIPGDRSWKDFEEWYVYLLFDDGKLVSPLLKYAEASPWEAYDNFTAHSSEEVLGPFILPMNYRKR